MIIGFILGALVGVILMCIVRMNKLNKVETMLYEMQNAQLKALKDGKSSQYINGMSQIIRLYADSI